MIRMCRPIRTPKVVEGVVKNPTFFGKGWIGKAASKLAEFAVKRKSLDVYQELTCDDFQWEEIRFDAQKKITELIAESRHSIEWVYRNEIDLILCGQEEFGIVLRDCEPMSFYTTLDISVNGQFVVLGMKVVMVPWMSGVLLMSSKMIKE